MYSWRCCDRKLVIAHEPLVMGVLNVTPDSFSDGGQFLDPARAVDQAQRLIAQGARIIDIGGASTRPGAAPVPAAQQMARVRPVIEGIRRQHDIPISIDTTCSTVAQQALNAGACIINDISGLTQDPAMPELAAATKAGVIIMHMQGEPQTMQQKPQYNDCVGEIHQWLLQRVEALQAMGVATQSIAIDPGIGFGKKTIHNLEILQHLAHFTAGGLPVVVGASRKRFIGTVGQTEAPCERGPGSLAALAIAVLNGASILRVHDVRAAVQAARVAAAIRSPNHWRES